MTTHSIELNRNQRTCQFPQEFTWSPAGTILALVQAMATSASRDTSSRSDCARQVRRLARRQEALRRQASRFEEEADALALDLVKLADDLDASGFGIDGTTTPAAGRSGNAEAIDVPRRTTAAARDALRRTAEAGAASLDLTRRFDGSADVRVDGGKLFVLPPTLADLLAILASDRGQADEAGMVGWKSIDEITRLLEKKSGRPFTVHAVTQQIYRLRRELFERGGVNPWLVQTSRRTGARFALRAASCVRAADMQEALG